VERVRNPLRAVPRAVELTAGEMQRFLAGLGHIVSGRVGRDAIGGPIEIATTDVHLARGIGEALHHAYQGDLDYHYEDKEDLVRVHWKR
jgi:hypothetical protein